MVLPMVVSMVTAVMVLPMMMLPMMMLPMVLPMVVLPMVLLLPIVTEQSAAVLHGVVVVEEAPLVVVTALGVHEALIVAVVVVVRAMWFVGVVPEVGTIELVPTSTVLLEETNGGATSQGSQ